MTATISGDGTSTLINLTTSGNTVLGDASTDTLNVGNGGLVKDASGNVGIGTASPTEKLDISGNLRLGASAYLKIGTGFSSYIQGTTNTLTFGTNSTDRVTIDSSGNLGLGVTGTIGGNTWKFGSVFTSLGLGLACTNSSGNMANFYTSTSTFAGAITANGSVTSYTSASDYRLKENVQTMIGALNVVSQLKPCTYTWKADGSDGQGFIAHELQEVVPECVVGEKDAVDAEGNPVYQGIDTSFLVATLTAAIQELKALVDTQASTITTLTDRITALEAK